MRHSVGNDKYVGRLISNDDCLIFFNTFVVSRAFMADAASQAVYAEYSQVPGLTSDLQGSVNVHRGVLLLVPQ